MEILFYTPYQTKQRKMKGKGKLIFMENILHPTKRSLNGKKNFTAVCYITFTSDQESWSKKKGRKKKERTIPNSPKTLLVSTGNNVLHYI